MSSALFWILMVVLLPVWLVLAAMCIGLVMAPVMFIVYAWVGIFYFFKFKWAEKFLEKYPFLGDGSGW